MDYKRILSLLAFTALLFSLLSSCAKNDNAEGVKSQEIYGLFDTVSTVYSYAGESNDEFSSNVQKVHSLLTKYHKLFDIYHAYAGINGINRINKNAGIEPVSVDKELLDFLVYAKQIHEITNGETNIAMGSVLSLWHDAREHSLDDPDNVKIPSADELREAAKHTDISNLIIDTKASTVYISDPKMSLDVGSIGKGYAAEKAAELLEASGVTSYILNIGGNICAIGERMNGDGWSAAIKHPRATDSVKYIGKVVIKSTSLVTSGDYERYMTDKDGKRYHHIIDKDTNAPSAHFSSVSVITRNSSLADALSTALFCMSEADGRDVIASIMDSGLADSIEVIWVSPSGMITMTDGVTLEKV